MPTIHADTLQNTHEWFMRVIDEPTEQNITTQLGVHLEEVSEMLEELTPNSHVVKEIIASTMYAVEALANHLKSNPGCVMIHDHDREKYLDAICDQIVTATGCARMVKMNAADALKEVNRSNFSKFDADGNPIFDLNKKVMKGPNYTIADLKPYT